MRDLPVVVFFVCCFCFFRLHAAQPVTPAPASTSSTSSTAAASTTAGVPTPTTATANQTSTTLISLTSKPPANATPPAVIVNAGCDIYKYECFYPLTPPPKRPRGKFVDINRFGECYWSIHYSSTRQPTDIKSTYFNENAAFDFKDQLEDPNPVTIDLHRSVKRDQAEGYYVFPYFLIIRPHCDDGQYGFKVYDFILQNNFPSVKLFYTPTSSRDAYRNTVRITLKGALVDLNEGADKDHIIIEPNPEKMKHGGDKRFCHREICYPAFVIPQPFLNFPQFSVQISAQGLFSEFRQNAYVTPFHSRKNEGIGVLEIAKTLIANDSTNANASSSFLRFTTDVDAQFFFPPQDERITEKEDPTLYLAMEELTASYSVPKNLQEYVKKFQHFPLDSDDFYEPQFTFLSAPVVAMAGFYRPDLVIMGDPDMKKFELFQWNYNQGDNGTIFDDKARCLAGNIKFTPSPKSPPSGPVQTVTLSKPMFARGDRDEHIFNQPENKLRYYFRRRYAPMNFTDVKNTHAIFEIISFYDRLLILTTSGLVTFYGNTNDTVNEDRVFKAFPSEKLHGCFKFVKIFRRSLQMFDPIIAVTHNYEIGGAAGQPKETVNQLIYYGRLYKTDKPIEWIRIDKNEYGTIHVHQTQAVPALGIAATTGDTSEALNICNIVRRRHIFPAFTEPDNHIGFNPSKYPYFHQCNIMDGSPMPTRPDVIQLLLKMSFTYFKNGVCDLTDPSCVPFNLTSCVMGHQSPQACNYEVQNIIIYVVAEHSVMKIVEREDPWTISSIIPRVPCQVPHFESIRTLPLFDAHSYFKTVKEKSKRKSCFEEFSLQFEDTVDIDKMTYTKQVTNHMFLYGKSFLHSSDSGRSFVFSRRFPPNLQACDSTSTSAACTFTTTTPKDRLDKIGLAKRYAELQSVPQNKVMIMAFATNSKYALLTSARDLWIGSTGHDTKLRVRPSLGYSVINLRQYNRIGLNEAVPFSIMFDSFNNLFELVAVINAQGEVTSIEKRDVNLDWNQRHQNFAEQLLKDLQKFKSNANANQPTLSSPNPSPSNPSGPSPSGPNPGVSNPSPSNPNPSKPPVFKYKIKDYNLFCAFNQMDLTQNYTKKWSRLQQYYLNPPLQHRKFGNTNTFSALVNYQVSSYSLVFDAFLRDHLNVYSRVDADPFEEWKEQKGDIAQIAYLKFNRKDYKKYGIIVEPRLNNRNKDSKDIARKFLIDFFFLDYGITVEFRMAFVTKSGFLTSRTDFAKQRLNQIQLNIDNADGDLIHLSTERIEIPRESKVEFVSYMKLRKSKKFTQTSPGSHLVPIPLTFHFIGGFSRCFELPHYGMKGESVTFQIMAGCQPATDLLFNWNSTVESLRFRHENEHYGDESYCSGGNRVCFYARRDMTFHFEALDFAKQVFVPFEGKFKLRVIAGGYSNTSMVEYTDEEQEAYNIQGKSDVSLIWTTAGLDNDNETQRKYQNLPRDPKTQESVLQAGKTRIIWSCNTLSPCQRIAPSLTGRTVFWFRIHITNKDVDPDTLCLHEHTFDIMVYGFPPSPEILLFVTLAFALFTLFILWVLFICCRNHRKLWRANKLKLWGWCLIVWDTFPKRLKTKDDSAEKQQQERDATLLSLQGHLNVPKLGVVARPSTAPERVPTRSQSRLSLGSDVSAMSSTSREVLPTVKPRKAPATWTDMVYEQIISRRLLSIVERNKRMHESILRKVDLAELQEDLEKRAKKEGGRDPAFETDEETEKEKGQEQQKDKKEEDEADRSGTDEDEPVDADEPKGKKRKQE